MPGLTRREFVQSSVALLALMQLGKVDVALAEQSLSLPTLLYTLDALDPIIDAETMKIHYGRHHQSYLDKLLEQLSKQPQLRSKSLEEIFVNVSKLPEAVRNNAGGHYNHTLFWSIMAPVGKGGTPSPQLLKKINQDPGSLEKLRTEFSNQALARFGSGWAWLILTDDKKLTVTSTPNQDNPIMDVAAVRGYPLLAIDVWEHAYYLKYQNKRAEYVSQWWSLVNWHEVNKRFDHAMGHP